MIVHDCDRCRGGISISTLYCTADNIVPSGRIRLGVNFGEAAGKALYPAAVGRGRCRRVSVPTARSSWDLFDPSARVSRGRRGSCGCRGCVALNCGGCVVRCLASAEIDFEKGEEYLSIIIIFLLHGLAGQD